MTHERLREHFDQCSQLVKLLEPIGLKSGLLLYLELGQGFGDSEASYLQRVNFFELQGVKPLNQLFQLGRQALQVDVHYFRFAEA